MATSEGRPTELGRRPAPKDKESVILNSTDERGSYIYFNILYQSAFKEGQNKWRDIGIALNLDPNDISAIENQSKPEDCFRQMLIKWFRVNEECYLSTFIEALRASNVELVSLIPRVEEAIISTHTQETQNTEVSETRPRKRRPSKTSLSEMEPNKRRPSERSSGQVRSGGGVDVEINEFEERFIILQKATLKELTAVDCKVSVSEFRQALMILPSSIKNENKDFVMSNYSVFQKAESIESILLYLNFYLSYIDFSLLEHIIDQFGSKILREEMTCYAQDMREFRKRTTISQALQHLPKHDDCPPDFSQLTGKINFDVEVSTLEALDEYRRKFASRFLLSHLAFFLSTIENGSLLVTWLVPTVIGTFIREEISRKDISFFLKNNILKLSLDGEQVYPEPIKVTTSQSSVVQFSKPHELSLESLTEDSQYSVNKLTVDTVTAKPHHSSKYSDPDPRHRETANKISSLIESTPDCCGLAIMIQFYIELNNISAFLSSTCRFVVYNPLVNRTSMPESLSVRSTMESVHLVELKHRPIVVVASVRVINHHHMYTDRSIVNIKDDIVEPLFSPATPHLVDNPKIFLFIVRYYYDPSSMQTIFPSSGGNYIVGFIECYHYADSVIPTILRALETPQESVQEIFKYLDRKINQLSGGRMTVIDHLKEPVYLHPDAPQGTHSGPGPTKKLPVGEQLEEVTSTVEKLNIDEDKN